MKEVSLTFDDGPNPPWTDQILDVLNSYRIPATFFFVGINIQKHSKLVKRVHHHGHQIGNHSFYHQLIPTLSGTTFNEIVKTQNLIENIIGPTTKIYRSPFGVSPPWLLKRLSEAGFSIAPTTQATWGHDYLPNMTAEKIINRLLSKVADRSIILLHDGVDSHGGNRTQTVQALPPIIQALINRGYKFKKLEDLMKTGNYRQYFYP